MYDLSWFDISSLIPVTTQTKHCKRRSKIASLFLKINLHAVLHSLILFFPIIPVFEKKILTVCVSPNLNIHFFSLYIDIASG